MVTKGYLVRGAYSHIDERYHRNRERVLDHHLIMTPRVTVRAMV